MQNITGDVVWNGLWVRALAMAAEPIAGGGYAALQQTSQCVELGLPESRNKLVVEADLD